MAQCSCIDATFSQEELDTVIAAIAPFIVDPVLKNKGGMAIADAMRSADKMPPKRWRIALALHHLEHHKISETPPAAADSGLTEISLEDERP